MKIIDPAMASESQIASGASSNLQRTQRGTYFAVADFSVENAGLGRILREKCVSFARRRNDYEKGNENLLMKHSQRQLMRAVITSSRTLDIAKSAG